MPHPQRTSLPFPTPVSPIPRPSSAVGAERFDFSELCLMTGELKHHLKSLLSIIYVYAGLGKLFELLPARLALSHQTRDYPELNRSISIDHKPQ